jgi:small subunit ribosomal protein S13
MTHILGNYIPENKSLPVTLRSIYGIGHKRAIEFCKELGFSPRTRITDLSEVQLDALIVAIDSYGSLDSELQREGYLRIQELIEIQAYRGIRHSKGLPVRGQRTTTNSRTQRRLGLKRLRR